VKPLNLQHSFATFIFCCKKIKAILKWCGKRSFISLLLIVYFEFILLPTASSQIKKPNIILILGDDIGYRALTINGGNLYSTPTLDSLSKNGIRFTQCYSSPLCSPSRFLLLTGKYNFRNYFKWGLMDTSNVTIANAFKNAGYKTGCFGKWQLDGGDNSIHKLGFDEYAVHDALNDDQMLSRYKNPHIYTHGVFLPNYSTKNKYGPDITSDSLLDFIEQNKSNPFFVYYPIILTHAPFGPTPNDPEFKDWSPVTRSDTTFFPSMIKYMDKKIDELVTKLRDLKLDKNTLIIFVGDNGTPDDIKDYDDEDSTAISGGKGSTTKSGTHVPLIMYWPGTITPAINDDLIDFVDFFPTLTKMANIQCLNCGKLDGIDFSPRLKGMAGTPRNWIFESYNKDPSIPDVFNTRRWAQTNQYKLYDTSSLNSTRLFFDIVKDSNETHPLEDQFLTTDQIAIKQQLLDVINNYVAQGFVALDEPVIEPLTITDSDVVVADSVKFNGGSTITSAGVVWDTKPNPSLNSKNFTLDSIYKERFSSDIKDLLPNTKYYIRAYATNKAGTVYNSQINFITPNGAPVAIEASDVTADQFIANWNSEINTGSYRIDVSVSPSFCRSVSDSLSNGFDSGTIAASGWYFSRSVFSNDENYGKAKPSIELRSDKTNIVTNVFSNPVTSISFWCRGLANNAGSLTIEGFDGFQWNAIDNITNISSSSFAKKYDAKSNNWKNNFIQFRFIYAKSVGDVVIDDIDIAYDSITPSFVNSYENISVAGTSKVISNLKKGTQYYYRVRAQAIDGSISGNSNTISVIACKNSTIQNINISNLSCYENNSGSISVNIPDSELKFNWQGPNNFVSTNQNIDKLSTGDYNLSITSNEICTIDTTVKITEPSAIKKKHNSGFRFNCLL
jgi:arylsulfatase A